MVDTMNPNRDAKRAADPALDAMYVNAEAMGISPSQVDILLNLFLALVLEMHGREKQPESSGSLN